MGEARYTKGPWIADDNEGFGAWGIWERMAPSGAGPAGRRIAQVVGDSAETDANAALIAASPALLEELDRARTYLSLAAAAMRDIGRDIDADVLQKRADAARAAIALATGGQS